MPAELRSAMVIIQGFGSKYLISLKNDRSIILETGILILFVEQEQQNFSLLFLLPPVPFCFMMDSIY